MTTSITLEPATNNPKRLLFKNAPYAAKDAIKALGAKWDPENRVWYIGTTKRQEAQDLVDRLNGSGSNKDVDLSNVSSSAPYSPSNADGLKDSDIIKGKCLYKGKTYLYLWHGTTKAGKEMYRLAFSNGEKTFFANASEVTVTKVYGDNYGGSSYNKEEGITFGDLKRYQEKYAAGKQNGTGGSCAECGRYSNALTVCVDSSGIQAGCCGRCANKPAWDRSFG